MITNETSDLVLNCIALSGKPIEELHIMELGNIIVKNTMGVRGKQSSKEWFNASNVASHISIDVNGKDGALKLDLGKRLPQYDNSADIVLNGGTAEHVEDIYECFKNMHEWCKVGGYIVTWGPPIGTAKHHSPWAFALHLPICLVMYSHCSLIEQDIRVPARGRNPNPKDNLLLAYVLQKQTEDIFMSRDIWEQTKVVERR